MKRRAAEEEDLDGFEGGDQADLAQFLAYQKLRPLLGSP